MSQVACQVLHVKSIAPPPVSLSQLIGTESSCDEPVLFITTPGADPSVELAEYAAAQVGRSRYHEVAMGQGQGELALALIKQCAKNGERCNHLAHKLPRMRLCGGTQLTPGIQPGYSC